MEIEREMIDGDGFKVPCVTLKPSNSKGAVVVVHGYGGFKEETLGLAWRIAEKGFTTGAIDLRGHGEHMLDLDENILSDLEAAISHFSCYGKVTAMGHSLGGRLSLISSADYAIGISPALGKTFSTETEEMIKELRDYRINGSSCSLFQILNELPLYQFINENAFIIYGSRDIDEVSSECNKLKSVGMDVVQIEEALHGDIFLYEPTFEIITKKLIEWYTD